jgi:uncharacterized protein YxeA
MNKAISDMYEGIPLKTLIRINLESKIRLGSCVAEAVAVLVTRSSPRIIEANGEIYFVDKTRTAKKGEWGIRKNNNDFYVMKSDGKDDLIPIIFTTDSLEGHYLKIKKPPKYFESVEIFPQTIKKGLLKAIYY